MVRGSCDIFDVFDSTSKATIVFDFGRADLHFGSHSHGSLARNGWGQGAKSEPMRHSEKKTLQQREVVKQKVMHLIHACSMIWRYMCVYSVYLSEW